MMSKPAGSDGRRHPAEAELLRFLARPDQTADYVIRNADMIKRDYPGSMATLLPKMRAIYRDKKRSQS